MVKIIIINFLDNHHHHYHHRSLGINEFLSFIAEIIFYINNAFSSRASSLSLLWWKMVQFFSVVVQLHSFSRSYRRPLSVALFRRNAFPMSTDTSIFYELFSAFSFPLSMSGCARFVVVVVVAARVLRKCSP